MAQTGSSVTETLPIVIGFDPAGDDRARESRRLTIELLRTVPSPFDRSAFRPGHITASAVVLSHDHRRLLLVYHRRLCRWLQPGGHVECSDMDVAAAARREVAEETGWALDSTVPPPLVGIDVHEIPATRGEPLHLHYDLTFGYAISGPASRHDRPDVVWCPTDRLHRYAIDRPLVQSVNRWLGVVRSSSPQAAPRLS